MMNFEAYQLISLADYDLTNITSNAYYQKCPQRGFRLFASFNKNFLYYIIQTFLFCIATKETWIFSHFQVFLLE